MHKPKKFLCYELPLVVGLTEHVEDSRQVKYLGRYLADLASLSGSNAVTIIEEPNYFDRDYLAAFKAYYGESALGYSNLCRRLHFFLGRKSMVWGQFRRALAANQRSLEALQAQYLGFTVVRPLQRQMLGRTVLAWYPDGRPHAPRITWPCRDYTANLAGLRFQIHGLAWQQQDHGVGMCATIALWSLLQASANDETHRIPTTSEVTIAAHRRVVTSEREFPSDGLNLVQMCSAIQEFGLAPFVTEGDEPVGKDTSEKRGFTKERFSSLTASLVRSKQPILIVGDFLEPGQGKASNKKNAEDEHHAVTIVGFRENTALDAPRNEVVLYDSGIENLYAHDDNLGPNLKLKITTDRNGIVELHPEPPQGTDLGKQFPDPTSDYGAIRPTALLVALNEGIRLNPDALHELGLRKAKTLLFLYNGNRRALGKGPVGFSVSSRFVRLSEYLNEVVGRRTSPDGMTVIAPALVERIRRTLCEKVQPMSLYLGLITIGLKGRPLLDLLYDTTNSNEHIMCFANVAYSGTIYRIMSGLDHGDFGFCVSAI